eukprot:CAMPEP_0175071954 /NCGR_PEP_ID=MMETSP0052_2-20121109/19585_1 /TAXON_ID=51329 ORGANISM="Polytomella parva, Strain SAG 63-3" /NCGR_SAMPLE_ID=MMETSP0052_2 /ASSEMBLY_ACC=CAM_ASM_000194 /LENGTH=124 /DNA_ID=CAMNT_0016339293 /DNA_START=199 /DNA_END=569 /DNA_ORIENTATION=-
MNVKIGDLGIAKVLTAHTNMAHTQVGTPYYLSPELCEDRPYNSKSDVWALGVVAYEMCMFRHPFTAENPGALLLKILRGNYTPVDAGFFSAPLRDIIHRCLTQNPDRRPDTQAILNNPVLRRKA